MYGKHHTEQAKLKISIGNTGKERNMDYRKKMSESKRSEKYSDLPMYVYYIKHKNNVGYRVKYHPNMKQTVKWFTSMKYTMQEKLQQAIEYITSLS